MAEVPNWLKGYLGESDIEKIEAAIAEAEKKTTGEIVPMIVSRCSHTGHAPYMMMAFSLASFLSLALFISSMDWYQIPAIVLVAASILALALGYYLGEKVPLIQRFCVPKEDQWHQVDRRAELEFYEAGLEKTDERTGILLFLSIMERRAVVLADKGISTKLPPETWDGIVQKLLGSIRQGRMEEGISLAITRCGEILAEHFPVGAEGRNELLDHLIIKE